MYVDMMMLVICKRQEKQANKNVTGVEPGITGLNPNVKKKCPKKKIDRYINEMK